MLAVLVPDLGKYSALESQDGISRSKERETEHDAGVTRSKTQLVAEHTSR